MTRSHPAKRAGESMGSMRATIEPLARRVELALLDLLLEDSVDLRDALLGELERRVAQADTS